MMFKFLQKTHPHEDQQLFDFLRKNDLFGKLSDDELAQFLPYLYLRDYKHNEVVFFTGDPSYALYIVKSGIVTLNLDIKEDFEKLISLRTARLFGDNAIIPHTRRIYTAIVETETAQLYVIPKENVLEILNNNAGIKAKVMEAFAETYNRYTEKLFKTYKSSLGFFDLHTVYSGS